MKLVWKLSAVVVAILTAAIALSGYANDLICAHYTLQSARAFLRFNSESIIQGIGQLMMSRNNEAIEDLIVEMSRDSTVYRDVRLVSHPAGEVVASRDGVHGTVREQSDPACAVCHARGDPSGDDIGIVDAVTEEPGGNRVLSMMTPITNEPGCRNAACHAHDASPPVLGFLHADYSLQRVDATVADRRVLIIVTVLVSLSFGILALWLSFARLLERPISELIAGTERIAASKLDFRFDQKRSDEIGVLEESFNTMAARIQSHRDELRATMEYLGGIVESSADIIITVTPDGFIETFNRGAEQTLGYSRAEVIGQRVEILFADPREREVAIARLKETDSVKNYETRFLTKDRQIRHVLLTLSYLRDRQGDPIGTFGISKDVTQEKELQRELVQSQKFAAIGQAVTGIQHGIKNMLNSLKGGAYLVRSGAAKQNLPQVKEGSAMLEEGIELIATLSRHMLDYAKEWKLELRRVDLNDLVSKVCELNRQTAADRGVTLAHEIPDGLPAVLCDPKLIHMAVTDILVNAIDACTWKDYASGESPEVVFRNSLTEGGDFFIIEIRDNGCGMSEDIRRNIFTPFFSTKKTRGTGLGLALTTRIINVHGGEVSVESEPDRGAAFRVHLAIDGPRESREVADG
ncbi:MAG: sensor histidine kinase [Planctomycetota bacterium]